MTPTFLANFAVGFLTAAVQLIISTTAWVSGSVILQGHMFWDNTNVTNTEYVGTTAVTQHLVTGNNSVINGYQSGANLIFNGVIQKKAFTIPCLFSSAGTSTGGLANYDFCRARLPLTTSGALTTIALNCGNVPRPFTLSGSFVKIPSTNISANPGQRVFQHFGRGADPSLATSTTVGTGAYVLYGTGSYKWNTADLLKIEARSATWNTGNTCSLYYELRDIPHT